MASKEGSAGIQWEDVNSTQLGEEDLFDMVSALMPLLAKWQEIGTALGLRHSVLEIIEATNGKNTRMCMQRVLVQYVRKSYNCDRFGDPSWMSMAKAVAHPAGGGSEETALAILKDHPAKVIQLTSQSKAEQAVTKKQPTKVSKVPQSKPAQDDHPYSVGCPVHLLQYDWFHGKLSQEEANKLLTAMGGPCFLVREERRKAGTLVLSVKGRRGVDHFPINRCPGWYEVTGAAHRFDTIWELVTYYKTNSLSGYSQLTLGSSCSREMEPVSDPVYSVVGRENPYQRGDPVDLLQHSWYYGEMSKRLAEKKLSELEDSMFLIWVESSELYLSLKLTDRMSHFKIERGPGWYTVQDTFQLFPSVPDLVGYYNLEQLPAASNVVNYYNLNGEFHSALRGLQHIYDYIEVKTTTMHVYDYITAGHRGNEEHTYDYITVKSKHPNSLVKACKTGDIQTVHWLLLGGADPNQADENNITALSWASGKGHEEVVTILIEYKANVNTQDKHGFTALLAACEYGHDQVVELLIVANAILDLQSNDGQTALHVASRMGNEKIVDLLIGDGCNIDAQKKNGWTALHIACDRARNKVVELLITAKATLDLQNNLTKASCEEDIQKLLDDPTTMDVLERCQLRSQLKTGQTALFIASWEGNEKIVDLLIGAGCNIDAQNEDGFTALHVASQKGHNKVVVILIAAGANLDFNKKTRTTALWLASFNGHDKVLECLIKSGCHVDTQNKKGVSALYGACRNGHTRVVEQLLEAKANPNILDCRNMTPLMAAAREGHVAIIKLLLSKGADVNHRNNDGLTAYDLAMSNGHSGVGKLLSDDTK